MEQATRARAHFERILLVCGEPDAGKSRLLRHMLGDPRLGGAVPVSPRVRARALSRERCLAVRFCSPHEYGDTQHDFYRKLDRVCEIAWWTYWRINYACAVQPRPAKRMPGIVDVCAGLQSGFNPERIRVVQLVPGQNGSVTSGLNASEIDSLRRLDVEVITIDARRGGTPIEAANARILADFFDFS